ncbi:MAG: carbohydrate porin [Candidatus Omnitrophota bacterium]
MSHYFLQRTIALFALVAVTFFQSPATAFAEPTSQDLLTQIQDLRRLVESQSKLMEAQNRKIEVLESKVTVEREQARQIPLSGEVTEHIEKRLLDSKDGYMTIGGLKMEAAATMVGQQAFNTNRNVDKKGQSSNDAGYSIDLAFEKEFDDWGRAFLHLETGDGLAGDEQTALFSTVNRDADDSDNFVSVTEAFYEHYLFGKQAGIRIGKIDPTTSMDQNEYANDETTQFLSSMFRNSPVIDFPDNALGATLLIEPKFAPWLEVSGGFLDGDSNGVDFINSGYMFGQVNFKPTFLGENRPGNYRAYIWRNNSDHSYWGEDATLTTRPGYGFGLSFDQKITDDIRLFTRYGWQDRQVYLLDNAWSVGAAMEGKKWKRENDVLGIAFGQAFSGRDWRTEGNAFDPAITRKAANEKHLEIYYSWQLNDHFTLSPNFQWIWDPYGMNTNPSSATDLTDASTVQADFSRGTVYLLGLRAQVNF